MRRFLLVGVCVAVPSLLLAPMGCATMKEHKIASGAVIGAATGAAAGALVGGKGDRGKGAAIGAAVGAAAGGGVGWYLDRRAKRFKQIEDVEVETVEPVKTEEPGTKEEPGQSAEEAKPHIKLRLSDEVLFDKGSSALKPEGVQKVGEIAAALREDPEGHAIVKGYTSSEGPDEANLLLSQRRAEVIRSQLIVNRVAAARITAVGMGESNPIADNATEAGRAKNRRVEIEVFPSEEIR